MVGPALRLATTALSGTALSGPALSGKGLRGELRQAAAEATSRTLLTVTAFLLGAVALFCFSTAALILLERRLDPAEAWAVLGAVYGLAGIGVYLAATNRRRG
ncbi:MAG: hypothetical protein JOY81_08975 [Alphaproteobacteria bacterium]|nr:hypothetical protein [Alphaproteobacteria bacterium]